MLNFSRLLVDLLATILPFVEKDANPHMLLLIFACVLLAVLLAVTTISSRRRWAMRVINTLRACVVVITLTIAAIALDWNAVRSRKADAGDKAWSLSLTVLAGREPVDHATVYVNDENRQTGPDGQCNFAKWHGNMVTARLVHACFVTNVLVVCERGRISFIEIGTPLTVPIRGRVTCDGCALPCARVDIYYNKVQSRTKTDNRGEFDCDIPYAAKYILVARSTLGGQELEWRTNLCAGDVPSCIDVSLRNQHGTIRGRVLRHGKAAVSADVMVEGVNHMPIKTDGYGCFSLNVPDLKGYRVTVKLANGGPFVTNLLRNVVNGSDVVIVVLTEDDIKTTATQPPVHYVGFDTGQVRPRQVKGPVPNVIVQTRDVSPDKISVSIEKARKAAEGIPRVSPCHLRGTVCNELAVQTHTIITNRYPDWPHGCYLARCETESQPNARTDFLFNYIYSSDTDLSEKTLKPLNVAAFYVVSSNIDIHATPHNMSDRRVTALLGQEFDFKTNFLVSGAFSVWAARKDTPVGFEISIRDKYGECLTVILADGAWNAYSIKLKGEGRDKRSLYCKEAANANGDRAIVTTNKEPDALNHFLIEVAGVSIARAVCRVYVERRPVAPGDTPVHEREFEMVELGSFDKETVIQLRLWQEGFASVRDLSIRERMPDEPSLAEAVPRRPQQRMAIRSARHP